MTHFRHPDLKAAYSHVASGGQALFVRRVLHHGRPVGWLIDNDTDRLYLTARNLGVRSVRILRQGRVGQCVDLQGAPFEKALAELGQKELALS